MAAAMAEAASRAAAAAAAAADDEAEEAQVEDREAAGAAEGGPSHERGGQPLGIDAIFKAMGRSGGEGGAGTVPLPPTRTGPHGEAEPRDRAD